MPRIPPVPVLPQRQVERDLAVAALARQDLLLPRPDVDDPPRVAVRGKLEERFGQEVGLSLQDRHVATLPIHSPGSPRGYSHHRAEQETRAFRRSPRAPRTARDARGARDPLLRPRSRLRRGDPRGQARRAVGRGAPRPPRPRVREPRSRRADRLEPFRAEDGDGPGRRPRALPRLVRFRPSPRQGPAGRSPARPRPRASGLGSDGRRRGRGSPGALPPRRLRGRDRAPRHPPALRGAPPAAGRGPRAPLLRHGVDRKPGRRRRRARHPGSSRRLLPRARSAARRVRRRPGRVRRRPRVRGNARPSGRFRERRRAHRGPRPPPAPPAGRPGGCRGPRAPRRRGSRLAGGGEARLGRRRQAHAPSGTSASWPPSRRSARIRSSAPVRGASPPTS